MANVRPRVFVALPLFGPRLDGLKQHCDVETFGGSAPITEEQLIAALRDVDGVLTSNRVMFPPRVLDAAPRLCTVSNVGVGYDNIDLAEATRRGIAVTNTPGVLTDAVADLVVGLIIVMARRLNESAAFVRDGRWAEGVSPPLAIDLAGKTLSIVGFGRIGREVASRAQAFKMRVVCFDARRDMEMPPGIERQPSLASTLALGDFVSLHVDLNPGTHHLLDAAALACMKPSAYLINAARGQVVDQRALLAALTEKRLAGAALDVLETEPIERRDPLMQLENVFIVPHIGSATVETRAAMLELAIHNLIDCLSDRDCACIVNPEALSVERSEARR